MNLVRQVLERMYVGECTITEHLEYDKPNGGTGFREVTVLMKEPCRLSFQNKEAANAGERASRITQTIKLFLRPDVPVREGSKITVTQNGVTADYTRSGVPAVYETHQEVVLDLWKEWA